MYASNWEMAMDEDNATVLLQNKMEEMEDSNVALKEFVIEKLGRFESRLTKLEKEHSSDVSKLREELSDISSFSEPSTPRTSTPKHVQSVFMGIDRVSTGVRKIPENLSDLDDEWQKKLQPFVPKTIDGKEKLNKPQLAFVMYWIDSCDKDVTGK